MFVAEVVVGNSHYCSANSSLIKPPSGYDSVSGNTNNSDVFIVYDLDQAYPAYFITFAP
jgi:hypothetical protein